MKTCNYNQCNNPVFGKGYCRNHQYLRTDKKPNLKVKKVTGELSLFLSIYNDRAHSCETCGDPIFDFSVSNFHHIKPKGRFPELRLSVENIAFICFDCHFKIHNS